MPATLGDFLAAMASLTARPLAAFDGNWYYLNQTMVDADAKTAPLRPPHSADPGEVFVPSSASTLQGRPFHFVAAGVELEGSEARAWGNSFPGRHTHKKRTTTSCRWVPCTWTHSR